MNATATSESNWFYFKKIKFELQTEKFNASLVIFPICDEKHRKHKKIVIWALFAL
jgi:hypothetical protein